MACTIYNNEKFSFSALGEASAKTMLAGNVFAEYLVNLPHVNHLFSQAYL